MKKRGAMPVKFIFAPWSEPASPCIFRFPLKSQKSSPRVFFAQRASYFFGGAYSVRGRFPLRSLAVFFAFGVSFSEKCRFSPHVKFAFCDNFQLHFCSKWCIMAVSWVVFPKNQLSSDSRKSRSSPSDEKTTPSRKRARSPDGRYESSASQVSRRFPKQS